MCVGAMFHTECIFTSQSVIGSGKTDISATNIYIQFINKLKTFWCKERNTQLITQVQIKTPGQGSSM